ncbi:MAG: prolipoprotein diacylglyceryl transferase [Firmicutes bacterium]|nr:prolipoprotein diacylglyceryl transferase [Bacillota bacterium]
MNPYIIQIGDFALRWYSLLILIGVVIGVAMVQKEGKRFSISSDFLFNMAFWAIIFGIIGARIYYVIFNYSMYKGDLMAIFRIWEGGLAIHGGIIAGALTIYIYCKKYNIRFIRITDLCVPALLLAQAIGRWGNFFNGEAHGAATSLEHLQSMHLPEFIIEGMNISGLYYEPTFLYESIACLIGFVVLIIIRRFKYIKIGTLTGIYLMYYSVIRFFIESMRTDSLMLGGFKAAQIVSIVLFLAGLVSVMLISRKGRFEDLYNSKYDNNIRF